MHMDEPYPSFQGILRARPFPVGYLGQRSALARLRLTHMDLQVHTGRPIYSRLKHRLTRSRQFQEHLE